MYLFYLCKTYLKMVLCKFLDEKGVKCCKKAYYNFNGLPQKFCGSHKEKDMVNLCKSSLCIGNIDDNGNIVEKCDIQGVYNYEGEKSKYCKKHKKEGMINVKGKKCIYIDEKNGLKCKTIASFSFETNKNELYCEKHKKEGMLNVKLKKCINIDNGIRCKNNAYYNIKNNRSLYCNEHKTNNMINTHNKKCIYVDENGNKCNTDAGFNHIGFTRLFCNQHKEKNMINVKNKKCINCSFYDIHTYNRYIYYKRLCALCFRKLYPEHGASINYRTKEFMVVDFIKDSFPYLEFKFNKTIIGGCSKNRPDIYLELQTHCLIIEIDENQHNNYDTNCEAQRINDIYSDIGLPMVFIRFNPDDYKIGDKNITSCFGTTKSNNNIHVKESKKSEWSERLEKLKNTIIDNIKFPEFDNQLCKFIYLFYDQ